MGPEPVRLAARVRIDLSLIEEDGSADVDYADRHALAALELVPDGARVVVWIGDRKYPWPSSARTLREHAGRLLIELEGSPKADIRRWLEAARTGQIGGMV